jgi:hypothetical protein
MVVEVIQCDHALKPCCFVLLIIEVPSLGEGFHAIIEILQLAQLFLCVYVLFLYLQLVNTLA